MPYYTFRCKTKKKIAEFDKQMMFKEYDEHKAGKFIVKCEICGKCVPEIQMGGINLMIYDATPRTLGALADKNSKYRIPQAEEEAERKREQKKSQGKHVAPKEISTPWDAPNKPNIDNKEILRERKEKKKEYVAKFNKNKSQGRSPRDSNKRNS